MNIPEEMLDRRLSQVGKVNLLVADGEAHYLRARVHIGPPDPRIELPSFATQEAAREAILARRVPAITVPRRQPRTPSSR